MTFRVVDLFSGPGGLGEGFASYTGRNGFSIAISAEMNEAAHNTLSLRAFFRRATANGDQKAIAAYYAYCHDAKAQHPSEVCKSLWKLVETEARQLTLGDALANKEMDDQLGELNLDPDETVLIGGPPCQAYSLVGRARNKGIKDYVADTDHRHFLYLEYLRILANVRPAVFIMENVKGILSSTVGGKRIFHDILLDLQDPAKALGLREKLRYRIRSLSTDAVFEHGMEPGDVKARDFVVKSEHYGIPQARHRVILVGVREGFTAGSELLEPATVVTAGAALRGLPKLRSRLSTEDSPEAWSNSVSAQGRRLSTQARELDMGALAVRLKVAANNIDPKLPVGDFRYRRSGRLAAGDHVIGELGAWIADPKLMVHLNHDTRSHMASDLGRYLYAASFADVNGRSPKGHKEFALEGLAPEHKNWKSGKFADRFRVQRAEEPSKTVTSHISKDGHAFIHPDPEQARSLTVREAARLQTFPDNYFFTGGRTDQYHQVGNAVPPLLAAKIAGIVQRILKQSK